jgi:16S rRNA (guanine(966)-N(2))-methyltransferase RsmD
MRVISGTFRGRRLKGPRGLELRPTGDRLKETLFNILAPRISGAVMLDVFSGTGAIGIEAISRGAGRVLFVEKDSAAVRLIRSNLRACGIEGGFELVQEDAFKFLRSLARGGFQADIIFLDPPYDWVPFQDLLKLAVKPEVLSAGGVAVLEHMRKAALPEAGDGYQRFRMVRHGDSCLSFYGLPEEPSGVSV